jgi:hypothetical protein
MAAARRLLLPLGVLVAGLVAVHPVLGGVADPGGAPLARTPAGSQLVLSTLSPGGAVRGPLVVANAGTAPGTFLLDASTTGSRRLATKMRLSVSEAGRVLYEGSPAGLRRLSVGVLAPGQERRLAVRVELSRAAGNALQGRSIGLDVTVTALG